MISGIYAGEARAHDQYVEMFQPHCPLRIVTDIPQGPVFCTAAFERVYISTAPLAKSINQDGFLASVKPELIVAPQGGHDQNVPVQGSLHASFLAEDLCCCLFRDPNLNGRTFSRRHIN